MVWSYLKVNLYIRVPRGVRSIVNTFLLTRNNVYTYIFRKGGGREKEGQLIVGIVSCSYRG